MQAQSAVAFMPARGAIVLGVDEQGDAADILRDANAAIGCAQQESAAVAALLEAEAVVATLPALCEFVWGANARL